MTLAGHNGNLGFAGQSSEAGKIFDPNQHREQQWPPRRWPVTLKDVVVAIPNHKVTEPQLKAGRSARLVSMLCLDEVVGKDRGIDTYSNLFFKANILSRHFQGRRLPLWNFQLHVFSQGHTGSQPSFSMEFFRVSTLGQTILAVS